MIRAVLDTNVIVSGILSPTGSPGQIIRFALAEQKFQVVTSNPILSEIDNVLRRPRIVRRHGWNGGEINLFLARRYTVSLVVEGALTVDVITDDPSDNMFLAAALEGEANYVVSGDIHLRRLGSFQNTPILPPQQFLEVLSTNP